MALKTSNYGVARTILGIIEYLLWGFLAIGIIIAFTSAGAASRGFGASGLVAAFPGIGISVGCLFAIGALQGYKAQVDTADYTYQMLGVARDRLAVSKQALAKADTPRSFADRAPMTVLETEPERTAGGYGSTGTPKVAPTSDQGPEERDWEYRGMRINYTSNSTYLVEGRTFETLELAKLHVDGEALRAELKATSGTSS